MAVTGIGTYASYTNSYGNTQNAGNKTGRIYKNAHEYKNYLTQKYDCLRSRDYALLTQSRTNRGSRSCLAGGDLQLDVASDFLCHNTCTSKFCGELRPAVQTSHGRTTSARPIKTVPRALARSRSLPETRVF